MVESLIAFDRALSAISTKMRNANKFWCKMILFGVPSSQFGREPENTWPNTLSKRESALPHPPAGRNNP